MGHRLTKIYTRTGDDGSTGLGDGTRVAKDSARIEAIGAVDELNSSIGLLLSEELPDTVAPALTAVQHDLFDLGGELSIPGTSLVESARVIALEELLDRLNAELPPLQEFILPGGTRAAAACHLARAICRRAERRLYGLSTHETINRTALEYLNRLSDLLFVVARHLNSQAGRADVFWKHTKNEK